MNQDKEKHVQELVDKLQILVKEKYKKGALEHGGNLWEVPTLPLLYSLREEIIDSFAYVQTAIDQLENKKSI